MTNDPTKLFQEECAKAFAENAYLHSLNVDLRHELAELRELLRSAACQRAWLLAAIALVFAVVVVLAWVMTA